MRGSSDSRQLRCLVTGGAGFIGSHLVEALVERGWQVRVLDDLSTGRMENLEPVRSQIEFIRGSICDAAVVDEAAGGVDAVFHLAALSSVQMSLRDPVRTHEVNAGGTLNVLLAGVRHGASRVVYSSTCAVYGDGSTLPVREETLPRPGSPYAAAKLAGEYYCQVYQHLQPQLRVFILRYFNVYGPRQRADSDYAAVIPRFISRLLAGQPPIVYGDGRQTRDFVYISDVVAANLACLDAETGGVYNIGSGSQVSVQELAEQLSALLHYAGKPEYAAPRKGEVRHSVASVDAAMQALGWQPAVSLSDGLRCTADWFRASGK